MSLKRRTAKGSLVLVLGEAISYGASFLRNILLARLLTQADFGVAATFSLIITLLEFSARLGVARLVVQDKEGDEPNFIATAHLVQAAVAVFSSILILACAAPLSTLFGIPGQRLAIMVLALAPLFRGFEHLDVRRYERNLRFAPSLLVEVVPQVAITLAAWPIASWLGDYRAVLVLLLTKGLASCVGSHLLAERRYRWQLQRRYVARLTRFGWPLLVNGLLMFGVFHGDQFLVATFYTMIDLGLYAAAAALTLAPSFVFARVFASVMLPVLSQLQDDSAVFAVRYRQVLAIVTLFAVVSAVGMVIGGEALMRLAYGPKYVGAGVLMGWLAAANALRTLRIAPALAAMAKGDSQNQMLSNLGRVMALLPAVAIGLTHQPLWWIASSGLAGEALGSWVSFVRLEKRDCVPLTSNLIPIAWVTLCIAGAGVLAAIGVYQLPAGSGLAVAALGACLSAAATIAVLPELRTEAAKLYDLCHKTGWRCFVKDPGKAVTPKNAIY
jgi:O-antigen/teichoic acid export membrane protein